MWHFTAGVFAFNLPDAVKQVSDVSCKMKSSNSSANTILAERHKMTENAIQYFYYIFPAGKCQGKRAKKGTLSANVSNFFGYKCFLALKSLVTIRRFCYNWNH